MNTHADKSQKNKTQAGAYSLTKKQGHSESAFQFVDNRTGSIAQRQVQEAINNSPRVKPLRVFQEMDNKENSVKQLRNYQVMADNYTFQTAQRKGNLDKETLQGKTESIQKKNNTTGLPDRLKTGIENLSGQSMYDVKVHYNSSQPSQLQAHAYAQGSDIHVASGQEKHLPHEAWHVAQQKQGRVKPTMQMKGNVNVNDDERLENEADLMGSKAIGNMPIKELGNKSLTTHSKGVSQLAAVMTGVIKKPGRKKQMMDSANLIGSGLPYVYIKPNFAKAGGKRNVIGSEVWEGDTTDPIGQTDHIDIFGHASAGNPGGLALTPLVANIESILVFPDEGWKGDIRIFSCYAAQSLGGDDTTRTIVELGDEIDKSSKQKMKGVTAIAGPSTKGNLGPKTGAVLALSNANIAVRKHLKTSSAEGLRREIKAKRVASEYALDLTEKEIVMADSADKEALCQIIFTALNRKSDNSGWWIAQKETNGWKSTKQPLVGGDPGQVSSLIGGDRTMYEDENDEQSYDDNPEKKEISDDDDNPEEIETSNQDNQVQEPKLEATIPHAVAINVRHEPNVIPSSRTSKESVSTLINELDSRINYLKIRKSQFAVDITKLKTRAGYNSSKQALERLIKTKAGTLKSLAERLGKINAESNAEEVRVLIADVDKAMDTVQ